MYAKLALRSIRRSVRDYAIYFVTLVFGVAVFYAVNSIGSQQVLFDLQSTAHERMLRMTVQYLGMFSVIIAVVLGFLVVYANRFLIKRRKKEFGTYLLLGMGSGGVAGIVLLETLLVGAGALVVGLVAGMLLSQALSFLTAGLFSVTMSNYRFIVSGDAVVKTLQCFAAIFVVVALLNVLTMGRSKLSQLLNANAQSEKVAVRNPWICLVVFAISVVVIGYSYFRLCRDGVWDLNGDFALTTTLMMVGTFLLFWSLAGFSIAVLTRAKGVYLKGLVPFTVRQLSSKVNTAFVSLWAVCIMLFFAITTFSVGMGLVDVFCGNIEESTPVDATLVADVYSGTGASLYVSETYDEHAECLQAEEPEQYADFMKHRGDIIGKLRVEMPNWDSFVKDATQVDLYRLCGVSYSQLFKCAGIDAVPEGGSKEAYDSIAGQDVPVLSVSQLNALRSMTGKPEVQVGESEFLICNNLGISDPFARAVSQSGVTLDVMGMQLSVRDELCDQQLEDSMTPSTTFILCVPDSPIEAVKAQGAIPSTSYVDINYSVSREMGDEMLIQGLRQVSPNTKEITVSEEYGDAVTYQPGEAWVGKMWPVSTLNQASEMEVQAGGIRLLITYLALYLGFVLLVATAAILAIQQLTEVADSLPRYGMLHKLGASDRSIFGSVAAQVCVYFLLPLAVAACHSACAIKVVSDGLLKAFALNAGAPIALAAVLVVLVYGSYLAVTILTNRSMVRNVL